MTDNIMEPILGSVAVDKLTIQKSTPLLSLWRSPLTLVEFKILDAYLARIDSYHPENRWVRFSKGELEEILGVKKINTPDLLERIQHLGIMVQIENSSLHEGFDTITLFERAICNKDQDGVWIIDLCCTPSAMHYIFNVDDMGYLRYKLRSVIQLTSRYSYLMFLYLERNRYRTEWDVSVDDLRDYLGCTEDTYKQYKFFNQLLLKRVQQELTEKTSCHFSYTPIRRGRHITYLHISLEPLSPLETSNPPAIDGKALESPPISLEISILSSACCHADGSPEFTEAEIQQIANVLTFVPASKIPQVSPKPNSLISKQQYLKDRYASMNRLAEKTDIRHRFNYLLKMIKSDAGIE